MNKLEVLVDYVMENEVLHFENELKNGDISISGYEQRLLLDWIDDDVDPTKEIKNIFKKINHIYAIAFCVRYL